MTEAKEDFRPQRSESSILTGDENAFLGEEKEKRGFKRFLATLWHWLTESKGRLFSLIFLLVFIALMIFLGVMKQDPTKLMLETVFWFENKTGNLGLYIGVGVISIFGNFVMFIPILYAVVIMFIAVLDVNVFILGIAAGIGATVGQIASWFVGRATKKVIHERLSKRIERAERWVERGLAPLMIFFFAATPLPDEVLLIMIGMIGYSLWKTLLFCFIGKIVLTLSLSIFANLLSQTAFGEWFLKLLFNVTRDDLISQTLPEGENVWTSIAIWIIAVTLVVLVTFIDWMKIFDRIGWQKEFKSFQQVLSIVDQFYINETSGFQEGVLGRDGIVTLEIKDPIETVHFPDESLWFFEEEVNDKRSYHRKSLISVSTVVGKNIEVKLHKDWLETFNQHLREGTFRAVEKKEMIITKLPRGVLGQGFISSNGRILLFTTRFLSPTIESNNSLEEKGIEKSNAKEEKQLRRKKIKLELLLESRSEGDARVWAIGLKEGTFLQMIKENEPEVLLYLWLTPLKNLSEKPEIINNLTIIELKESDFQAADVDSIEILPVE